MTHFPDISKIEPEPGALELIPADVAREEAILAVSASSERIHVIVPAAATYSSDAPTTIEKLRFILNRQVTYDTADREQLLATIDKYYPSSAKHRASDAVAYPISIPRYEANAEFPFLSFTGKVRFQTKASVSFELGRWSGKSRGTFIGKGWIDAHYPCSGFHSLFIRCALPNEATTVESIRELVPFVAAALALPATVPYKIVVLSIDSGLFQINNPELDFLE